MIDKIIIISNLRSLLLLSLLIQPDKNKTLFIIDREIWNNITNKETYTNVIPVRRPKTILFLIIYSLYFFLKFTYYSSRFLSKNNLEVWGADHILGAKYFLRRFPFFLIEDGTANYELKSYTRSWKNKLFSIPVFGLYKNVKKVYLTQKESIPEPIKDKVEIININTLWNKKTDEEKVRILEMFNFHIKEVDVLVSKKTILYTQPLSEDNVLTEEEKISLYNKIISKYDISDLVIKPHPREKTDYKEVFKDIYVFKSNIPSELLDLLNIKFDKVITLFSTAVLQYDEEQVDFYGTVCHSKLKEHFGDIRFFKVNSNL